MYISVEIPEELIPSGTLSNPFRSVALKIFVIRLLGITMSDLQFTKLQVRSDPDGMNKIVVVMLTETNEADDYIECVSTIRLVEADMNMLGLLPDRKSRFHYLLNEAMMRNIKP